MSELKNCPFCGVGNSVVSLWFDDVVHRWRVGCGRCGCSTGISPRDKTEAPAIAAWNTRTSPLASLTDGEWLELMKVMRQAYTFCPELSDESQVTANAARKWLEGRKDEQN